MTKPSCFKPLFYVVLTLLAISSNAIAADEVVADPYLHLEDVLGESALEWVEQNNNAALEVLTGSDTFDELKSEIQSILNSDERIPFITKYGDWYYNFWQGDDYPRGVLRRTTLDEYRKDEPKWEVVLDISSLSEIEGESWVFKNLGVLMTSYDRALLHLSRGGADATVVREFDLVKKKFVEDGFKLPEAKSGTNWVDENRVLVSTDFGEGSLTESGYPRIVKLWNRGDPIDEATTLYEGNPTDVSVGAFSENQGEFSEVFVRQSTDFYNTRIFIQRDDNLIELQRPTDSGFNFHLGHVYLTLRTDWTIGETSYISGSLLSISLEDYLDGSTAFELVYEPKEGTALVGVDYLKDHLVLVVLENVIDTAYLASRDDGQWRLEPLPTDGEFGQISVTSHDSYEDNRFFLQFNSFTEPTSLSLYEVGKAGEFLKSLPDLYDNDGITAEQHWVTSADGTKVPYFQVGKRSDEPQPTLLYGYGGFNISMGPQYSPVQGNAWLEKGAIYVLANIRGGGEFGPQWHQAALLENRPRAYEDFIAIAEDLVDRGITTPSQLGTQGGSNGGLLMGNMLTRRPDLFGAIVAQVPLFDMQRYHLLLAGASWMAEYGDPDDPEQWKFIKGFSPYHNVDPDAKYPPVFVTTSTRDDRVHPGHARKMVARLTEYGHNVTYYENTEGGHAGAADNAQRAFMLALAYQFLYENLGLD